MKKVKKLTIILAIVLLSLISFIGIYVEEQNIMKNVVKEYDLGMNLSGYRQKRMTAKKDQQITSEKVEEVKGLIKKRLKQLGAEDYLLKVDYTTGEMVLELEENNSTDRIVADIYTAGELKMVDSEDTTKVHMTNNDVKSVSVKYSATETGTGIYLDLEFTEEGAKKIEDLSSNAYKTIEKEEKTETEKSETETTTEGEEKKEEVKQPKLMLMIDDSELVSSSFDFPITTGRLQLSLNSGTTDEAEIQEAVNSGLAIAGILNNGPLPIKYQLDANTYVYSEITNTMKNIFAIAMAVIILIALVVLVIKYKMSALLAAISYIGFIALYLLVLRYANVVISLEGVAGIIIILIINYLLLRKLLQTSSVLEAYKEIAIQLIPVIVVIIAFSFIRWTNIARFWMTMFWGFILTAIYNVIVTKVLIEK